MKKRKKKVFLFGTILALATLVFSTMSMNFGAQPEEDWVKVYSGPNYFYDWVASTVVDSKGNVYISGPSFGDATKDYVTLVSYDPDGNMRWVAKYNSPANNMDYSTDMTIDSSDRIYLSGRSIGSTTDFDAIILAYDTSGTQLWVERYDGPNHGSDGAKAITTDSAGNIFVTGATFDGPYYSSTNSDILTMAYNSEGQRLWIATYDGPGIGWDEPRTLTTDSAGNVYVTGWTVSTGGDMDLTTIKYDSSGNEIWVNRYDGPEHDDDLGEGVVVSESGDIVFVTGLINGWTTKQDYLTLAYDSSDGTILWTNVYNGPGNDIDFPISMTIDAFDNVYVTGYSIGTGTSYDYATIKYDSDGNELWVARFNGQGNGDDWGWELAIGPSGNLYVTGYSYGSDMSNDITTIAYNPSDGTELWVMKYNSEDNKEDIGINMAFDIIGNVYVGGTTEKIETWYDYILIKYSVGPEENIENLIKHINNLNIPEGFKNSLISKLENALKSLEKGNYNAAMNQINAFINEVEAQSGKKLSIGQSEQLAVYGQFVNEAILEEK